MDERKTVLLQLDGSRQAAAVTEYVESEMLKNGIAHEACIPSEQTEHIGIAKADGRFRDNIFDNVLGCAVAKKAVPSIDYILVGSRTLCQGLKMSKKLFYYQVKKHSWSLYEIHTDQSEHQIHKRTSSVLLEIQNNERKLIMKTRKEIKEIFEAINQNEDKSKSLKENMIRYCVDVEQMTEEEAEQAVTELIKGTSDFTESLDNIHGKSKEEISAGLVERLDAKLKDLPSEDIDKILQNLFLELSALSIEQMNVIASELSDDELKEAVKNIRRECNATLDGKTYEEKLNLVADAVQNCGSLSVLLTFAEDDKGLATATALDDAISTATLNGSETAHIIDELENLRTKNYSALAEYISARHGTHPRFDSNTPAYNIGVSAAADAERKKIKADAIAGVITFDNAIRLLGTIAVVALTLTVAWLLTCFTTGFVVGTFIFGSPIAAILAAAIGIVVIYEGVKLSIKNRRKIGNALAVPVIGIKNLVIRLVRGFCRIFNISLPNNKDGMNVDEEEDIAAEDEDEFETETANENKCSASDTDDEDDLLKANMIKD